MRQRADIVNKALYRIYSNIEADLTVEELAKDEGISAHHLHRIWKEETGKNLHETIKSIRLQKAANLLLSNRYANISQIAAMCGYGSQTSFIKAFRSRFDTTPTLIKKVDQSCRKETCIANCSCSILLYCNAKSVFFVNCLPIPHIKFIPLHF